jgi:hypothetical protein
MILFSDHERKADSEIPENVLMSTHKGTWTPKSQYKLHLKNTSSHAK